MITLEGVRKSFEATCVIDHVDLSVERGCCTALIGPSGCGKSTLLRLMLGLLLPDSGSVTFDGQRVQPSVFTAIRRRTGYVIQEGGLFPHLTARENVVLMARQSDWDTPRIHSRMETLIELTNFPRDGLDRYPVELSGGQRQRVALMRALMLDPDVLLLDEPLGALDPMIRYDLQVDLKQIFSTLKKTVVLVTHDLGEADFLGDELVLIRNGQIIQQGRLDELTAEPAEPFVTRFVRAQRGPGTRAQ